MHNSWTGGATDNSSLEHWLDPCDLGVRSINGKYQFSIIGPATLCSYAAAYTISLIPSNDSVAWRCSNNITMISDQGSNPCYFEGNTTGSGWLDAIIYHACGEIDTLPIYNNIQVNPVFSFISKDFQQDCNSVTLSADLPSYTTVTWSSSSNFLIDGYYSPYTKQGNSITVTSNNSSGGSVYGTTDIGCAVTEYSDFCPCQPWDAEITWLWACPAPGEPLEGEVSPLQQDAWAYKWYIGNELIETTSDGNLYTHNWHCTSELPPIYVAGVTSCGQTELIFGGDFFPACGGNKMSSNINLYPNPSSDIVTFKLKEYSDINSSSKNIQYRIKLNDIIQIKIIDKLGMIRKVAKFGKGSKLVTLNLSDLLDGQYLCEISDGVHKVRLPLIKVK